MILNEHILHLNIIIASQNIEDFLVTKQHSIVSRLLYHLFCNKGYAPMKMLLGGNLIMIKPFKKSEGKHLIFQSYDKLLELWGVEKEEIDIITTYGKTHAIIAGNRDNCNRRKS